MQNKPTEHTRPLAGCCLRKADILLIGGLLAAAAVMALEIRLSHRPGDLVQVRVAGAVTQTLSLREDVTCEITGADGGHNLLVIRDGAAWIEEADCPDERCVHMGKIRQRGQSIVCLPHSVVVEVVSDGDRDDADVDVIAG